MRVALHVAPQVDPSEDNQFPDDYQGFIFQWDAPKDLAACGKRLRQRLFLTGSYYPSCSKALSQAVVRRHPSQTRTRPLNS
jgi:hypothetical protein